VTLTAIIARQYSLVVGVKLMRTMRRGVSPLSVIIIAAALIVAAFLVVNLVQDRVATYIKAEKTTVKIIDAQVYKLTNDPLPPAVAVKGFIINLGDTPITVQQIRVETSAGPTYAYESAFLSWTVNPNEEFQINAILSAPDNAPAGTILPENTVVYVIYTTPDGNRGAVATSAIVLEG